ncbi:GNAT family N-acetyltransferase [Nonomuraea sp. NPDC050790]|uniref:GNAT family N-acetyltransferase n=1 Tax=Nonomuraea sp. NPDC050790 TaxID=3364371 RepID=UPI0037A2E217
MGYRRYDYRGPDDLREMQALSARAGFWHPGELAWSRFEHVGREPEWPTALWEHDGRTVAWAWAQLPGSLDLELDPEHRELAGEILGWFAALAPGERTVTVLDGGLSLTRYGYREDVQAPFFVRLRRELADLPEPVLPDGYRMRPVGGAEDAPLRARVHRAAFSTPEHPSRVSAQSYLQVMGAWPYRSELDWLVETDGGEPAAFCLLWLEGEEAVLEPVGTDPAHRRRGLAGAVTLAALRAARGLGARSARVNARGDDAYPSARATYESIGFRHRGGLRSRTYVSDRKSM